MANYLDAPMVPIQFLRPKRATFDQIGAAIDGGVNVFGEGISMGIGAAARVTCTYEECVLQADDMERHEVINWIGARGTGGSSFFAVPFVNDEAGPAAILNGRRRPIIYGIPHSDGSLFSDSSGYSQATVWGEITEAAAVGAGIIKMRVYGAGRALRWSDWFSIFHLNKGWRAYRYWKVIDKTEEANPLYTLAIKAALREAVVAGQRVELARPTCVMKFPTGFTLPWSYDGWYQSRPTLRFVEAF